jgi:hypothetical protein
MTVIDQIFAKLVEAARKASESKCYVHEVFH